MSRSRATWEQAQAAGYRLEQGTVPEDSESDDPTVSEYWWTFCDGGDVECGDTFDNEDEAIDQAIADFEENFNSPDRLIDRLRSVLIELMVAHGAHRTKRSMRAETEAHQVLIDTTPDEVKDAALKLAQKRNPTIESLEEALHHYGTSLFDEVAS